MRFGTRTACGLAAAAALAATAASPAAASTIGAFTGGDLVISVYGDGDGSGTYTDNQASPITLQELSLGAGGTSATAVGTMVLPQSNHGANWAISGEYGSSSEGTLELSADGHYLTIAGYGISAAAFDANPASFGGELHHRRRQLGHLFPAGADHQHRRRPRLGQARGGADRLERQRRHPRPR